MLDAAMPYGLSLPWGDASVTGMVRAASALLGFLARLWHIMVILPGC